MNMYSIHNFLQCPETYVNTSKLKLCAYLFRCLLHENISTSTCCVLAARDRRLCPATVLLTAYVSSKLFKVTGTAYEDIFVLFQ